MQEQGMLDTFFHLNRKAYNNCFGEYIFEGGKNSCARDISHSVSGITPGNITDLLASCINLLTFPLKSHCMRKRRLKRGHYFNDSSAVIKEYYY